jgi:LDH2 family malate/lactate/ureidoglycolate dehydrogenase
MKEIDLGVLRNKAINSLRRAGLSEADADIIFKHLLDAEASGHSSHGFMRMTKILNDLKSNKLKSIRTEEETAASVKLNGGMNTGIVVAQRAIPILMKKAKKQGVAVAGGYNVTGTIGQLGYFVEQIAANGFVGFMVVASEYAMAPWGGRSAVLGTNPIAFGFPTEHRPIVIDLATSAWAYGNLKLAMLAGESIPTGVVIDADGNDSTDPNDADRGSQLPMAGHKGYALALGIEILGGLLVGAKAGYEAVKGTDGFFMMGMKSDLFISKNDYRKRLDALIEEMRKSELRPGVDRIYIPGEKSQSKRMRFYDNNSKVLTLSDQVYEQVISL